MILKLAAMFALLVMAIACTLYGCRFVPKRFGAWEHWTGGTMECREAFEFTQRVVR